MKIKNAKGTIQLSAAATCAILDELFPGYDNGGISLQFKNELEEFITKQLYKFKLIEE